LSDDDIKNLRALHANLPIHDVKLLSQDTLDRATLTVDDASVAKQKLLSKYPVAGEE